VLEDDDSPSDCLSRNVSSQWLEGTVMVRISRHPVFLDGQAPMDLGGGVRQAEELPACHLQSSPVEA
jgi:hypothetical protein